MASEILSIPEESLKEVIAVIRAGIPRVEELSSVTRNQLLLWCDEEEEYLNRLTGDES